MIYLTCHEGNSNKFYEINADGCVVSMRYGRTGSDGISSNKSFGSLAEATKFVDKTVAEKLKKGYKASNTGVSNASTKDSAKQADTIVTAKKRVCESVVEPAFKKSKVTPSDICNYLECVEGGSNKFYEIKQINSNVNIRFGKCGTDGQSLGKSFDTFEQAAKFVAKTVAEKEKKGYASQVAVGEAAVVKCVWDSWDADLPQPTNKPKPIVTAKIFAKKGATKRGRDEEDGESDGEEEDDKDGATTSAGSVKYLTCTEGNSDKFYEISATSCTVSTRYGRSGTNGQSSEKKFKTPAEALKFVDKTVVDKAKKGYKLRASCQCEASCTFLHGHTVRHRSSDDDDETAVTQRGKADVFDFLTNLLAEKKKLTVTEKRETLDALRRNNGGATDCDFLVEESSHSINAVESTSELHNVPTARSPPMRDMRDNVIYLTRPYADIRAKTLFFYEISYNNGSNVLLLRQGFHGYPGVLEILSTASAAAAVKHATELTNMELKVDGCEICELSYPHLKEKNELDRRVALDLFHRKDNSQEVEMAVIQARFVKEEQEAMDFCMSRVAAHSSAAVPCATVRDAVLAAVAGISVTKLSHDNGDVQYVINKGDSSVYLFTEPIVMCGTIRVASLLNDWSDVNDFIAQKISEYFRNGYTQMSVQCTPYVVPKNTHQSPVFLFVIGESSLSKATPAAVAVPSSAKSVTSTTAKTTTAGASSDKGVNTASATAKAATAGSTVYLECNEGNSNKFYEIVAADNGTHVTTRYGKVGSAGVMSEKTFKTAAECTKFVDKTVAEKLKKGYQHV